MILFRLVILLGISLISIQGFAQKKKSNNRSLEKLFIGFDYGAHRTNLAVKPDLIWQPTEEELNNWKRGTGNFYQLVVGGSINKNISISSGIGINNFSTTQTKGFGFWSCDPSYYGATKVIKTERLVYLNTVELPLQAKYQLHVNRFNVYTGLGLRTIFYANKRQEIYSLLDNGVVVDHDWNNIELSNPTINFAVEIKAGASYNLFNRFNIKLEPYYRFNLKEDAMLTGSNQTKLKTFGVSIGLEYVLIYD